MKNIFIALLFILLLSCNENVNDPIKELGDPPIIISPLPEMEFNTMEEIRIDWKADSGGYFETQLLNNNNRFYTYFDKALFDSSSLHSSHVMQRYYSFSVGEPLDFDLYWGFRVRQIMGSDTSKWSDIVSFVVYPISQMTKIPVTIDAEYNFISQNKYPNYSDIIYSNYLNLDSLLNQNGHSLINARTIKPKSGTIIYEGSGNGLQDFSSLVFGIDTVANGYWPFDVIADSRYGSGLTFYPFGGTQRNFKGFFSSTYPQIKMAYNLDDTTKINVSHKIITKITFDAYYR